MDGVEMRLLDQLPHERFQIERQSRRACAVLSTSRKEVRLANQRGPDTVVMIDTRTILKPNGMHLKLGFWKSKCPRYIFRLLQSAQVVI
jgi:hypothetical protein